MAEHILYDRYDFDADAVVTGRQMCIDVITSGRITTYSEESTLNSSHGHDMTDITLRLAEKVAKADPKCIRKEDRLVTLVVPRINTDMRTVCIPVVKMAFDQLPEIFHKIYIRTTCPPPPFLLSQAHYDESDQVGSPYDEGKD